MLRTVALVATLISCLPSGAFGQTSVPNPLTLSDAVALALRDAPAIREARARADAAEATVGVARTAYLPRLDALWQENRATANSLYALLLPQAVISPITGPVLPTRSYGGVWSSAAGALLSWEVVDCGLRRANIDVARAGSDAAAARRELSQLDVSAAAADAFLTVLAADQAVRAALANVDRLQVFGNAVSTLVRNQLRPGADESRANAELAIAKNQVSQAVQTAEAARAVLGESLGSAGATLSLTPGRLSDLPALPPASTLDLKSHPAVRVDFAAVEVVRAREHALDRAYAPHVTFQSAAAARGGGAQVPGLSAPGSGFGFQAPNWALGVTVSFPAFEIFTQRARRRVESATEAAEAAHAEQTIQRLTAQDVKARALMTAAAEIARNTPVERQAAVDAEAQARARYDNGLASVTEVAEAQRLLAQADVDDAVARLGVWRALLATAQVRGDLAPFLNQLK